MSAEKPANVSKPNRWLELRSAWPERWRTRPFWPNFFSGAVDFAGRFPNRIRFSCKDSLTRFLGGIFVATLATRALDRATGQRPPYPLAAPESPWFWLRSL